VSAFPLFIWKGPKKTQELHEKYYIHWMAVARGISVPLNRIPFFLQINGGTIAFLTGVKHLERLTLGEMGLNRGSNIKEDLESAVGSGLSYWSCWIRLAEEGCYDFLSCRR